MVITSTTVLPGLREDMSFTTRDGFTLVGEVSRPESVDPRATALFFHPLPTAGGFMDSHIIRKASWRLPALADIAVVRFNFRGVTSPRGTSEGSFGQGDDEALDLEAAINWTLAAGLPKPWLVGCPLAQRSSLNMPGRAKDRLPESFCSRHLFTAPRRRRLLRGLMRPCRLRP